MTYSEHNNFQLWQYWFEDFEVFFCNFFEESERNITHSRSLFWSLWEKHYNCTKIQPDQTKSNLNWPKPARLDFFSALCCAIRLKFWENFRLSWRNSFNQNAKCQIQIRNLKWLLNPQIRTQRAFRKPQSRNYYWPSNIAYKLKTYV